MKKQLFSIISCFILLILIINPIYAETVGDFDGDGKTDVIVSRRNVQILGSSPMTGNGASYNSNAVYYKLASNQAKVFAIGSTGWNWGLDEFSQNSAYGQVWKTPSRYNPNAETLTRNVLDCFIYGGATCGS